MFISKSPPPGTRIIGAADSASGAARATESITGEATDLATEIAEESSQTAKEVIVKTLDDITHMTETRTGAVHDFVPAAGRTGPQPEPRLDWADWAVLAALTWLQRPLRMGRLDMPEANQITEMMILVIPATRARPSAAALRP